MHFVLFVFNLSLFHLAFYSVFGLDEHDLANVDEPLAVSNVDEAAEVRFDAANNNRVLRSQCKNDPDISHGDYIEIEDYTDYYDTTPKNHGNYRVHKDSVDLYSGYEPEPDRIFLGNPTEDEWLEYELNASKGGEYKFKLLYTAEYKKHRPVKVLIDGKLKGEVVLTDATGTYREGPYKWVTLDSIDIPKGCFTLRLKFETFGFNLDKFYFKKVKGGNSDEDDDDNKPKKCSGSKDISKKKRNSVQAESYDDSSEDFGIEFTDSGYTNGVALVISKEQKNEYIEYDLYSDEEKDDMRLKLFYASVSPYEEYKVRVFIDGESAASMTLKGTTNAFEYVWYKSKKLTIPEGCFTLRLEFKDNGLLVDKFKIVSKKDDKDRDDCENSFNLLDVVHAHNFERESANFRVTTANNNGVVIKVNGRTEGEYLQYNMYSPDMSSRYRLKVYYSTDDMNEDYSIDVLIDGDKETTMQLKGTRNRNSFEWGKSKELDLPDGCFQLRLKFKTQGLYVDKIKFILKDGDLSNKDDDDEHYWNVISTITAVGYDDASTSFDIQNNVDSEFTTGVALKVKAKQEHEYVEYEMYSNGDHGDYALVVFYATDDSNATYDIKVSIDGKKKTTMKLKGTKDSDVYAWGSNNQILTGPVSTTRSMADWTSDFKHILDDILPDIPGWPFTLRIECKDKGLYIDKIKLIEV